MFGIAKDALHFVVLECTQRIAYPHEKLVVIARELPCPKIRNEARDS
jgi:hypothetical protein